jgi:hypothetical protein
MEAKNTPNDHNAIRQDCDHEAEACAVCPIRTECGDFIAQAKHTPGPWGIDDRQNVRAIIGLGAERPVVASVAYRDRDIEDAFLIAAAPDMYEALVALLDAVNVRIDDPRIASFDAARAALAKAEGR